MIKGKVDTQQLFELKLTIQDMEQKIKISQKLRRYHEKRVLSFSHLKKEMYSKLLSSINISEREGQCSK